MPAASWPSAIGIGHDFIDDRQIRVTDPAALMRTNFTCTRRVEVELFDFQRFRSAA